MEQLKINSSTPCLIRWTITCQLNFRVGQRFQGHQRNNRLWAIIRFDNKIYLKATIKMQNYFPKLKVRKSKMKRLLKNLSKPSFLKKRKFQEHRLSNNSALYSTITTNHIMHHINSHSLLVLT